jgi:FKBP-type peptidyl-prolyl cis-trans isomerase SlyD
MQIEKNAVVTIDYTLTDGSGKVIDTSKGKQPLAYLHGGGNLIPGLERALEGKKAGDNLKVTIAPEDAYGMRDEKLVQVVPSSAFQGVPELKPGMQFRSQSQQGSTVVTVTKVEGDNVTVDANHPLAGMALSFDVDIKDIRQATKEELEHGHVHGPGGHHHH